MNRFGGYNRFEMSSHERTLIQAQADAIRDAIAGTQNDTASANYGYRDWLVHKATKSLETAYKCAQRDATDYITPLLPKTKEQALDHINAINATGAYPDYIVNDRVRNAYMWLIRHLMAGKNHDAHLNYDLVIKYYVAAVTVKEKCAYEKEYAHASIALGWLDGDPRFYDGPYGDQVRAENDNEVW